MSCVEKTHKRARIPAGRENFLWKTRREILVRRGISRIPRANNAHKYMRVIHGILTNVLNRFIKLFNFYVISKNIRKISTRFIYLFIFLLLELSFETDKPCLHPKLFARHRVSFTIEFTVVSPNDNNLKFYLSNTQYPCYFFFSRKNIFKKKYINKLFSTRIGP